MRPAPGPGADAARILMTCLSLPISNDARPARALHMQFQSRYGRAGGLHPIRDLTRVPLSTRLVYFLLRSPNWIMSSASCWIRAAATPPTGKLGMDMTSVTILGRESDSDSPSRAAFGLGSASSWAA